MKHPDFKSQVFFKEVIRGKTKSYLLHFMPDDTEQRKKPEAFIKANYGLVGVFQIKVTAEKIDEMIKKVDGDTETVKI
jgi:hypothetical protein